MKKHCLNCGHVCKGVDGASCAEYHFCGLDPDMHVNERMCCEEHTFAVTIEVNRAFALGIGGIKHVKTK